MPLRDCALGGEIYLDGHRATVKASVRLATRAVRPTDLRIGFEHEFFRLVRSSESSDETIVTSYTFAPWQPFSGLPRKTGLCAGIVGTYVPGASQPQHHQDFHGKAKPRSTTRKMTLTSMTMCVQFQTPMYEEAVVQGWELEDGDLDPSNRVILCADVSC